MRGKSSSQGAESVTPRLYHILLGVLPMLLALALYAYALRLPYFLDDGPHFIILGQTDGFRHWGYFPTFPFYRPLAFTLWKLFAPLGYPVVALHALNVFAFGLIGVLTGQITRKLSQSVWAGVLAGCFVMFFPLSYQAVVMVAALFHLLMALGVCVCLWAGMAYVNNGKLSFLILCGLGAFVALFSHENGVLIAVFLPVTLWLFRRRLDARLWQATIPVWALTLLYIALWLAFSPNDEARTLSAEPFTALAALGQGIAYPFVRMIRLLIIGDAAALFLLTTIVFVLVLVFGLSRRRLFPLLGYGLMWYVLALLPAILILPPGYVLGQLRLALLASIGGGIFWGVALASHGRPRWFNITLIMLTMFISVEFLHMRRLDFLRLADWNMQAVSLAPGGDVVVINAPMSITPNDASRRFLLGSEGVLWTDPNIDYSQQFWLQSQTTDIRVQALTNPALVQTIDYGYTVHGAPLRLDLLRQADYILHTEFYTDGRFIPVLVGGQDVDASTSAGVVFPQIGAVLAAADWSYTGDVVVLRTRWMLQAAAPVKLFAHVTCDGILIAQNDGYIWGGNYPFSMWLADESNADQRFIRLPAGTQAACLQVLVGLYDENTGERLIALHVDETRLPDDAYTVPGRDTVDTNP